METERERRSKKLLKDFLQYGIQEPDALYFYIQEYLGYTIPTKAVCPYHQSPFEFIKASFFEEFRSAILMGARLSGKTLILALLNHLDSMLKGKIEIVHSGASLFQANRGYRYYQETFDTDMLRPYLVRTTASRKQSYNAVSQTWNGSVVGITAGTMKGLNCLTGDTIIALPGQQVRLCDLEGKAYFPILSFDIDLDMIVNDTAVACTKTGINSPVLLVTFSDGSTLKATREHLVLVWRDGEHFYREVERLQVGDTVESVRPFQDVRVVSVLFHGYEDVYDIETETYHNFYANGIAVHNSAHGQRVKIDEVEVINSWELLQESMSISHSTDTIKAQDIFASTRKRPSGIMQRLLTEADDRDMKVFSFCLSGESVVRRPSGDARIRDLVGQEFLVYSVTSDGELVLRPAKNVRKTRKHMEVFEVVYEWWGRQGKRHQESIVATSDHKFMMLDGSFKEVGKMEIGDSLMPFHKRQSSSKGKSRQWRVGFIARDTVAEHRFVWEQIHGEIPPGHVIHHKDGNDYNNSPENLECMLRAKHSRGHTKRWWRTSSEEKILHRNQKVSDYKFEHNPMSDPVSRQKAATWWSRKSSEEQERLREVHRENRLRRVRNVSGENHQVVAIYHHGYEDVYCMEVEDTHNFAVNSLISMNCVWEVVETCTRDCIDDKLYGTCPILNLCKGRAHHGNGWFKVADLISKAKSMSPNTFSAQWECKKPSDSQLVYGNYWYEDVHVLSLNSSGRFKTLKEVLGVDSIPNEWRRVGGIDFGARFCYLQFAIDPRTETWIAEYEYFYEGDRLMETHAANIRRAPAWPRRMPIYADPAGKQERIELARTHGIKTMQAIKNIETGVDTVKNFLTFSSVFGRPRLFVMDTCMRLRMEFESWSHTVNKDGTPNLDDYENGPCDALDTARYCLHSYNNTHLSRVAAITIPGL